MLFVTSKIAAKSALYFGKQQKDLGRVNGYIEEMMDGQKVVKVFCHEEKSIEQFKKLNDDLRESARNANTFASITMPVNSNGGNISYWRLYTSGFRISGYRVSAVGGNVGCMAAPASRIPSGSFDFGRQGSAWRFRRRNSPFVLAASANGTSGRYHSLSRSAPCFDYRDEPRRGIPLSLIHI